MILKSVKNWYHKYENHISSISRIGGFVFDAVSLKRVDLFLENFWVVVHLGMAAVGIVFLNLYESGVLKSKVAGRAHFWFTILLQFAFGGLLSTFLVFYFRSATLAVSWPFFLMLAALFASNELLKKHYARLTFQIVVFFVSLYLFLIFYIPVLLHGIGDGIFILSGIVSLVIIFMFLWFIRFLTQEHFQRSRNGLRFSIVSIVLIVNVLYFYNIIPPIPLSLKDGGVYHSISRSNGDYVAMGESLPWYSFFEQYESFHQSPGDAVYVYSAVFSPPGFNTDIVHQWQHYDGKNWVTMAKIPLLVVGGRDSGFRTYSSLNNLEAGRWRVNVNTLKGQGIGRVSFEIQDAATAPELVTEIKK